MVSVFGTVIIYSVWYYMYSLSLKFGSEKIQKKKII